MRTNRLNATRRARSYCAQDIQEALCWDQLSAKDGRGRYARPSTVYTSCETTRWRAELFAWCAGPRAQGGLRPDRVRSHCQKRDESTALKFT
jgi:hypothetical protein